MGRQFVSGRDLVLDLVALAECYGTHLGHRGTGISAAVFGPGDYLAKIKSGEVSPSARTIDRHMRKLADQWPVDLEWPEDIPHPAPRAAS